MFDRRIFLSLPVLLLASEGPNQARAAKATVLGHVLEGLDGNPIALSRFRGKVMLIVNTASKCSFTPQYAGLERMWRRYGARGLVVIGVPSNDFGGQEPGNSAQIREFCSQNHDVTFPMATKTVVKGGKAHPLFRDFSSALGADGIPDWNFHKVLVGRDGVPVSGFPSAVRPEDSRITLAIEAALARPAG